MDRRLWVWVCWCLCLKKKKSIREQQFRVIHDFARFPGNTLENAFKSFQHALASRTYLGCVCTSHIPIAPAVANDAHVDFATCYSMSKITTADTSGAYDPWVLLAHFQPSQTQPETFEKSHHAHVIGGSMVHTDYKRTKNMNSMSCGASEHIDHFRSSWFKDSTSAGHLPLRAALPWVWSYSKPQRAHVQCGCAFVSKFRVTKKSELKKHAE